MMQEEDLFNYMRVTKSAADFEMGWLAFKSAKSVGFSEEALLSTRNVDFVLNLAINVRHGIVDHFLQRLELIFDSCKAVEHLQLVPKLIQAVGSCAPFRECARAWGAT